MIALSMRTMFIAEKIQPSPYTNGQYAAPCCGAGPSVWVGGATCILNIVGSIEMKIPMSTTPQHTTWPLEIPAMITKIA